MTNKRQAIGKYLGPVLFLIIYLCPTPLGMNESAKIVAAIACLMATWWIAETIPFAITALLPFFLFPLFGVVSVEQVTNAYANQIIFLFMAGFIFALCIERWNLHRRIALFTIKSFGFSPSRILLGFMVSSAFLSMWVSNTATTLMMIPIAIAVASRIEPENQQEKVFSISLLLGIAYAASIGGVATLIGTPPNAILAGILEQQTGLSIGFLDWMKFGLPLSLMFLVTAWFYLNYLMKKNTVNQNLNGMDSLNNEIASLPPLSKEEKTVAWLFAAVCICWIGRGLIDLAIFKNIKDSTIGLLGASLLYLLPANQGKQRLMDWQTTKKLPWEILILFGGGFALAAGFEQTQLTHWLALQFSFLQGINILIVVFCIVLFVIFLTEITSNTATATLLIPLMIALSDTLDVSPVLLAAAVAVATSYAFMLPVATPPNAIVFSSGRVPIQKMVTVGFWLNIIGSILITFMVITLLPLLI